MRFYRLIGLCLCIVLASGCTGPPGTASLLRRLRESFSPTYETAAKINTGDMSVTALISHPTPEACVVTVSEPQALSGFVYRFGQDGVEVSFMGLSAAYGTQAVPDASPVSAAVSALGGALLDIGQANLETADSHVELNGLLGEEPYTLILDQDALVPVKLLMPRRNLEIELDNFTFFK